MEIFSLSNSLSFLRGPLAFLFLFENTTLRLVAILLAMVTDSIDGYLARRRNAVTRFGAILDPVMDKFFVFFALMVFFIEGRIELWQACAMLSRDFFLCVFGVYLAVIGYWANFQVTAIRWGKVSTALQFIVLVGLAFGIRFSNYLYGVFVLFGLLAFIELWQIRKVSRNSSVPN